MMISGRPCGGTRGPAPVDTGTGYGWVRGGLLAAMLVLAGCSWSSVTSLWDGDEDQLVEEPEVATEESTEAAKDVPGQAGAYPNRSSVPDRDNAGESMPNSGAARQHVHQGAESGVPDNMLKKRTKSIGWCCKGAPAH